MTAAESSEGERGQAIIMVALMMAVMLGMLGLIVDGGMLLVERRSAQSAADAAALAAAYDLVKGNSSSAARASALYYASQNGYDNNGHSNSVSISLPPSSGAWAGNGNFAQVTITKTVATAFIQLVYRGASATSATATAGVNSVPVPFSILILNPTACGALTVDNNGHIGDADDVHKGAIMVDSNCASAINVNNNGDVSASSVGVVGGAVIGNNATVSPLPKTGLAPVPDPLANVPVPDLSKMTVRNGSPSMPSTLDISNNKSLTVDPGIYYGGMKVYNNGTLTLNPGNYVIAGGGLTIGNNGTLRGSGVFIYNSCNMINGSCDTGHGTVGAYGSVYFDNNSTVSLTPPSSGTYEGLLFFQDRNNTKPVTISNNGANTSNGGTLYFPKAACSLSNNAAQFKAPQIICDTAHVSNNALIDNDYEAGQLYDVPTASLVE